MSVSYVKLLLKQGVSKGSGVGFECEVCVDENTPVSVLKEIADKAAQVSEYLIKKDLIAGSQ